MKKCFCLWLLVCLVITGSEMETCRSVEAVYTCGSVDVRLQQEGVNFSLTGREREDGRGRRCPGEQQRFRQTQGGRKNREEEEEESELLSSLSPK